MKAGGESTPDPLVSVIILTKNAGPRFTETLAAIRRQDAPGPYELIVIDSGSRDGTLALSRRFGAQVLRIPPRTFSHSGTRNEGLGRARGEFVILLVQDAVPADGRWMAALVEAVRRDPRVAGAYSRQLPFADSDYLGRYVAESWHRHVGGRWVQEIYHRASFSALPWAMQRDRCTFNNVSAIIRRSVWQQHPFAATPFAEDMAWARQVLSAGYRVVYEPASRVMHVHERPPSYELRRAFVDARALAAIFALPGSPMSVVQARALVASFASECEAASRDLAAKVGDAGLQEEIVAFYEGEEWYRSSFDGEAVRYLFGPASPWSTFDKSFLSEKLDWQEQLHRSQVAHEAGHDADEAQPPLSERIAQAAQTGMLSKADAAFVFSILWREAGRDFARRAVLDKMAAGLADPVAVAGLEQCSFVREILNEAAAEGCLTSVLYWRVRLCAAAWAIGRRLGLASVAPRDQAEERFWRSLQASWARGI